jgi:hypothetical protein
MPGGPSALNRRIDPPDEELGEAGRAGDKFLDMGRDDQGHFAR